MNDLEAVADAPESGLPRGLGARAAGPSCCQKSADRLC